MADVLVVAELSDGKIKKTTHSAITFAQTVAQGTGGKFSILVLGAGATAAAQEVTAFGAAQVFVTEDPSLTSYIAERYAPNVVAAAKKGFGIVVTAASAFGKDLLPRVAAALDAGYANDISAVKIEGSKVTYKRPMYAGNAYGYCEVATATQV